MKKIFLFLTLASAVLITSCTGDPGPQGPPGGLEYAKIFEANVNGYSYDARYNQLYSNNFSFPFTVYESDVVLAYRLSGSDNSVSPPADVWTQLPQSKYYFGEDGTADIFQYNFNHTFFDVQFTIEGNFPLNNIDPADTQNQIFRIAVVPSEFARTNPSMEKLLEVMQTTDSDIQIIEPK